MSHHASTSAWQPSLVRIQILHSVIPIHQMHLNLIISGKAMAKIIDLPVEIIRMIALMVLPEDFENFAGASKHVASVTQDLLEKHRLLVKNYLHRGSDQDGTWYMIP